MNLAVPVLLCLSLVACSHRPTPQQGNSPIEAVNPVEMLPMAEAWCDESPLSMGVDTGATQAAVLFSPSIKQLGGKFSGKGSMQTTRLQVSLTRSGKPLAPKTDVSIVKSAPYDGLLGWKTLRNFVWHLNIPQSKHQFFSSLPRHMKGWSHLHLVKGSDYAQVHDTEHRLVLIDTGAPYALYIASHQWEQFKLEYPDAPVLVYSGYSPAAGGYYARECILIKSFSFQGLKLHNVVACESFTNPTLVGLPKEIDIVLGMEALSQREFWIDAPNNKIYFSQVKGASVRPRLNLVGATFIPQKDGKEPYRAYVAPWSTAWRAGLRSGDYLVSMNGRKHFDAHVLDYITTTEGAEATVVVRRLNNIITLQWTVPDSPEPADYHPTPVAVTPEIFEQMQEAERLKEELKQQSSDPSAQPSSPDHTTQLHESSVTTATSEVSPQQA
jgi:hypothetical protein